MGYRIQARVGVAAPAFAVWEVISALDTWKDWNPYFTEAEGRLSIGSLVPLRRQKGERRELEEVRIVDWVPNEQILWSRTVAPFARVVGFLEIEALSEVGCVLAVGELYTGLLGEHFAKAQRRSAYAGWLALAEAAKQRAEATWDGTPGESLAPPPAKPKAVKPGPKMSLGLRAGPRLK